MTTPTSRPDDAESADAAFIRAARWLARLRSARVSAGERLRFDAWRRRRSQHEYACRELESLWNDPALEQALRYEAQPIRRRTSHRPRWIAALAGVCLLALAIDPFLLSVRADYRTGVGEQQTVRLTDGSLVTLDTGSAIAVDFESNRRRVRLLAGSAFFDVQHDTARPFYVKSHHGSVRVTGTRFAVSRDGATDAVTLLQGSVAVNDAASREAVNLMPNQRIVLDAAGSGPVMRVDADVATAWRDGHALFDNASLKQVVEELARYRHGRIVFADPRLTDIRVSGRFLLRDGDRALASLEQTLPIRLRYITPLLVVVLPAA